MWRGGGEERWGVERTEWVVVVVRQGVGKAGYINPLCTQAAMDLPEEKKLIVLGSSAEKKRQLVRDSSRPRIQVPISDSFIRLQHVMDADSAKVSFFKFLFFRNKNNCSQ